MAMAVGAALKPAEALEMGWCELKELARAHRRQRARQMVEFMVACQGDEKSWKNQIRALERLLDK